MPPGHVLTMSEDADVTAIETNVKAVVTLFVTLKHGHVSRVRDWLHSSFHHMVKLGTYPLDWAGDADDIAQDFGER